MNSEGGLESADDSRLSGHPEPLLAIKGVKKHFPIKGGL